MEEYCKVNLLTVNTDKSKVMKFSRGGRVDDSFNFYYAGEKFENVGQFTYLGVLFSSSAVFSAMSQKSVKKAKVASASVLCILSKMKCGSWEIQEKLFNSLASSTLYNCLATWGTR